MEIKSWKEFDKKDDYKKSMMGMIELLLKDINEEKFEDVWFAGLRETLETKTVNHNNFEKVEEAVKKFIAENHEDVESNKSRRLSITKQVECLKSLC